MIVVMWDSDGVDFPFTLEFAERVGWPNPQAEWESWSEYKRHDWSTEKFLTELTKFAEDGGFNVDRVYDDFVPAWRRIDACGVKHVVVTDKPTDEAVEHNERRLKALGCPPHHMVRSRDKTVVLRYADPGDIVFGIDDNVSHVRSLRDAGVLAYLRDKPWNQGPESNGLPRVKDLHRFAEIIEAHHYVINAMTNSQEDTQK
jgi:hypothetical protein